MSCQIKYQTHKGSGVVRTLDKSLAWRIPLVLGRLWQARIQATAYSPDGEIIGEVFKRNGKLTWWYEEQP